MNINSFIAQEGFKNKIVTVSVAVAYNGPPIPLPPLSGPASNIGFRSEQGYLLRKQLL
jgi:hypothetical protein